MYQHEGWGGRSSQSALVREENNCALNAPTGARKNKKFTRTLRCNTKDNSDCLSLNKRLKLKLRFAKEVLDWWESNGEQKQGKITPHEHHPIGQNEGIFSVEFIVGLNKTHIWIKQGSLHFQMHLCHHNLYIMKISKLGKGCAIDTQWEPTLIP